MTKTPDFEKAAKEKAEELHPVLTTNNWHQKENAAYQNGFLAGCEHAYSIDKETIERLEKENKELKKQQKLANDYILALNDYHESIYGRDIRCDQSLYNKAQKAGEDYADSLESGK